MAIDNGSFEWPPSGSGSGGGVTSLNGQTGDITLIAGTNITITPGSGTLTIDASGGISSINGDPTAAQTLSVGTSGIDFAIVDAGGGSHIFNLPDASASARGALTSADWTTFNNKFDLPAFTSGSVLFSDGTTIAQDNTNFFWDDTGKTLALGGVFGGPGTVPYAQTSQRTATNPAAIDGTIFGIHYSNNSITNPSLNTSGYFEGRIQIDTGVSVAANAGVIFQAYRNNGSSDAGSLAFLVGAFGGAHQIGTDPAATTDLIAGVLSQVDISNGIANRVADFYGLAGINGGTINTGQFGIYIEPPGAGVKDNWLSGKALIGGSSYASHGEILKVDGDMSATISSTDSGAAAGIFNASSNTTVNGSNTTIGINGVALGLVQTGAENDKTVAGMNFAVTRGDTTDQGILDNMNGANVLLFINSDTAGVTNNAYGFATTAFSEKGTLTNLYDYYSERVPGAGVITNHYGVYIKDDPTTPVLNWLSGRTQMGGSSFAPADSTILDLQSVTGALLVPRMDNTQRDALTAAEGMIIYSTTDVALEGYMGGTWTSLGGGGGGGANQHLSNLLSPTAINQDLIFDTGAPAFLKTKDDNTADTQSLTVTSGSGAGFASGALNLNSGTSDTANSGSINISTGTPGSNQTSGDISSATGTANGTGNSGSYFFNTGTTADASSGNFTAESGGTTGSGTTGSITLQTGGASGTGGSGDFNFITGNTVSANTGTVNITTGDSSAPTGNVIQKTGNTSGSSASGQFQLTTGQVVDGTSGQLALVSGNSIGEGSSGSASMQTGDVVDGTSGAISFTTGTASGTGSSGTISLTTDSVDGAGASGSILLLTGDTDTTSNAGNITLTVGNLGSGAFGNIQFQPNQASTPGSLWIATDGNGSGQWNPTGASGSFTTADAKTVTVVNGIITSIV